MDHRRVQRALFRMQLDPEFAARTRAGDAEATRGLAQAELRLLLDTDARAVAADREGRRRAQFLANVSSEFPLSCAAGLDVGGFTASPEFHDAVCADTSLPLALARYALRTSAKGSQALRGLIALESALARARRELRADRKPAPEQVVLAPWVWIEALPAGTLALAARIREALDAHALLPALALRGASDEALLIRSSPPARPLGLRGVEVEHASPALSVLLRAALEPVTPDALAAVSSTPRAELDPVIDELIADRVLLAG